jgi:hypothetical protein
MNTTQTSLAVLGSAAIGALVSSAITVIAQWRERLGRQRELLLVSAIDLSKAWLGRITATSNRHAIVPEVIAVERTYKILKEIFDSGTISEKNRKMLRESVPGAEEEPKPLDPSD